MITFEVNNMSCSHCVGAITEAVHAIDGAAQVRADLGSKRVEIEPKSADAQQLQAAINDAGYTANVIAGS